jgi:hypothetical protein
MGVREKRRRKSKEKEGWSKVKSRGVKGRFKGGK